MKGVHLPAADQSATVPAEVIEVGSGFETPVPELPAKRKRRSTLLGAGALFALLVAGLALVPGNDQPSTVTVDMTLREPAMASSTIPAVPRVVSVVTDRTFSLIPLPDLNGFAKIAGPVQFANRYWVAASPPLADHAVVLSSIDGQNWAVESELVGPDQLLRVQDLVVFQSQLAIIATSSNAPPTPNMDVAQTLLAWTSSDGRSWFPQMLPQQESIAYGEVTGVVGGDQLLVWAGVSEAYGELIYPSIPVEFEAALATGQLWVTWERRSEVLRVSVVAPPSLEVFSTEVPVSGPNLIYQTRLLRSEDLAVWKEIDPAIAAGWGLDWSEHFGFVMQSMNGGMMNSSDGREWQSTDLPTSDLLPWRGGFLALVNSDLIFVEDGTEAWIRLPSEIASVPHPRISTWITVGPNRIIAAVTHYEIQGSSSQEVASGELLLTWRNGYLSVTEGATERVRIPLQSTSPASYDPIAQAVIIDPGDGEPAVSLPLDDLSNFWFNSQPARTDFYQSQDGVVWSKAENALLTSSVTLIGAIEDGFLIGMGGIGDLGEEETMTVFRTGPID